MLIVDRVRERVVDLGISCTRVVFADDEWTVLWPDGRTIWDRHDSVLLLLDRVLYCVQSGLALDQQSRLLFDYLLFSPFSSYPIKPILQLILLIT